MNGDVGSTATMPTVNPFLRYSSARRVVIVLLPAPGGPVIPIRRARPRSGCNAARSWAAPGRRFSTMLIARASAEDRRAAKSSSSFACAGAVVAVTLRSLWSPKRDGNRGVLALRKEPLDARGCCAHHRQLERPEHEALADHRDSAQCTYDNSGERL